MYFWMDLISRRDHVHIHHKLNSGEEKRVGPYLLDGYVNGPEKIAYEFYGCWYHGHGDACPLFRGRNLSDKNRKLMKERLERTQKRAQYLRDQGYEVISVWECDYEENHSMNAVLSGIPDSYLPPFSRSHSSRHPSKEDLLEAVSNDSFFGMLEVDIYVPKQWSSGFESNLTPHQYFGEMCPLFCNVDIPFEQIGAHMQDHAAKNDLGTEPRRSLVGGMSAEKILLATPLLKWYIEHGLRVTRVYQAIEFVGKLCFKPFQEEVSNARREGDLDPNKSIISDTMKLLGNSGYGSLILDKTRHQNVSYLKGKPAVSLKINDPKFKKCTELGDDIYEVEMAKSSIDLNIPITLGYFILQYAKLRMLELYYDCIDKYVSRS
jgi:hypothetical protein